MAEVMLTKNFARSEIACRCGCGLANVKPKSIAKIQLMRDLVNKPLRINSACRCPLHNARLGGAPRSQHRATELIASTAFDISLEGHDKDVLVQAAIEAGFKGIGASYKTFLHVDDRERGARW